MNWTFELFIFSLLVCLYYANKHKAHKHKHNSRKSDDEQIEFAMDKFEGLNPNEDMHLTHKLFHVHLLQKPHHVSKHFHFVGHANFTALVGLFNTSKSGARIEPSNNATVVEMFEHKLQWKQWMQSIGLEKSVPRSYSLGDAFNHEFPMILKTNQHFGRGVFVLHNEKDLKQISSELQANHTTFMLEESLTGLGLQELFTWGGAFQGRLLSMRCMLRGYSSKSAVNSAFRNSSAQLGPQKKRINDTVPFVRGFLLKASEEHSVPCSRELVAVHTKMFAATDYSGSWCSQVKTDRRMRPKLLEVNPRFCGSLASHDALFVLSYVPVAFAMLKADPTSPVHYPLTEGKFNATFQQILANETRAVETGGGMYKGQWLTVEKFDPELRLSRVKYRLLPGTAPV